MDESDVCLQCRKSSSAPSNRLVLDSCGHRKCRSCLLDDIENCKQCLMPFGPLKQGDRNTISNADNVPSIVDNHTAVIHCNGKARCNSDLVVAESLGKEETFPFVKEHQNNCNESAIHLQPLETIQVKEKTISKKKIIHVPSHITVNSDPVCYLCTICNKSFITKSHIKYHKYCSGELKPYKCEICHKEFILKVQLQIHMCKHSNVKPFKCNMCSKSFSEKSKLSRHMVLHSAGKNFICPDCAKSFKTKESLRIHCLIHKNEKPFSCKIGSAKFNNSSNLKKHLISHSNEKLHMCDQCGRRFKLKWALSVHRKSHLSVRPHTCSVCSKSFVNLKDLQRHILIHAETKGFTCGICLTSFRRKDNLHRHMKNAHPGKKGDIIKNSLKVLALPKKSVVIDNPNAVNVITASPAITKCKVDTVVVPLQQPTAISTDSRPTGSVINGPIKLAFKTPAFKSNYNITRGSELVPSAQIATTLSLTGSLDLPLSSSVHSANLISRGDEVMRQNIMSQPSQRSSESVLDASTLVSGTPQQDLSSYSSVLHYETSFQNRKHAMIKNIKFKVPEQYTNSFKTATTNLINNSNSSHLSADSDVRTQVHPVSNRSVIVNNSNSSDVHWRRRTSQNLVLKN